MEAQNGRKKSWLMRHKLVTTGIIIVVLVIFIAALGGHNSAKDISNTKGGAKNADAGTETKRPLPQSVAENYCEDANLLSKYIDMKKTNIVTLSYHPYYIDSGSSDKNGYPIYTLQWSGEDKSTGDKVLFVCSVSGADEGHIELHSLSVNGSRVFGE